MTTLLGVPEVVIDRLPVYARTLAVLDSQGRQVVSSQELGAELGVTPAQIRKDLSYFGRFGKQGRGYNVRRLAGELRAILGLDQEWRMVLVGVGNLGRAILSYRGFAPEGFRIIAAFDTHPETIGKTFGGIKDSEHQEPAPVPQGQAGAYRHRRGDGLSRPGRRRNAGRLRRERNPELCAGGAARA